MNSRVEESGSNERLDEDIERAHFYALIGRLFYGAPDSGLIAGIRAVHDCAVEPENNRLLLQEWSRLRGACGGVSPAAVRQEYDDLFVGVGKARVTPYTSYYVTETAADKHLLDLKDQLGRMGLARRDAVFEVEDHISGLCDVMRFLIEDLRPLAEQRRFFESFVYPTVVPFFAAVSEAPGAGFYKQVASFSRVFIDMEKMAFDMPEVSDDHDK